ncbi:helix-turn-helix domain-containing protein [Falsiroseomonas sp. CW058]|uniref:helix-turn-helix domain-containing protein n=1 Tax=Falsiroseomonas sp. CW058 TaxID=3388664 RepID=UPI003D31CF0E
MLTEPTLADLAAASGLQPRTIRSWVAQGILPGPLNRGPAARYPADTLHRLLAIRAMRDLLGMPLGAIRQELLVATPEQIAAHAAKATGLGPETPEPPAAVAPAPDAALDYLRGLRAKAAAPTPLPEASMSARALAPVARPGPASGFEALETRLGQGRAAPAARKARAEEWLRIPITPDVEFAVRGRLDAEARARIERCADLVRDILLGRDR